MPDDFRTARSLADQIRKLAADVDPGGGFPSLAGPRHWSSIADQAEHIRAVASLLKMTADRLAAISRKDRR